MLKKYILLSLFMSVIETSVCEEVFSLQDSYDVEIGINGTDQKSIQEGMAEALSSLVINITGNSAVVRDKSIIAMMKSPVSYTHLTLPTKRIV